MARRRLKTGFSTGSAAAAAGMAALELLIAGRRAERVRLDLPQGGELFVPVAKVERTGQDAARATVIKDAGDDPDATHRAAINAEVFISNGNGDEEIRIEGGAGVGRVTRPGLPVPIGEPAINPVPRQMIADGLRRIWREAGREGPCRVRIVVSVDRGEEIARRTLNPRLGIVGGISILGTTGLVRPLSHEAYTATIESALSVAEAMGLKEVILTTGGRSEKHAMAMRPELPEPSFIQIADFFGFALEEAGRRRFPAVGVVSFFGKAVKQAQGLVYTHAQKAPMDLDRLAEWFEKAGAPDGLCAKVRSANTARHALDILKEKNAAALTDEVGRRLVSSARGFLGQGPKLWAAVLDYDGTVLFKGRDR